MSISRKQAYNLVRESKANRIVVDEYGYPTGKTLKHTDLTIHAMSGSRSEISGIEAEVAKYNS